MQDEAELRGAGGIKGGEDKGRTDIRLASEIVTDS